MNTRDPLISLLIFPIAPIVVIYCTYTLCDKVRSDIFDATGQEDGAALISMALFVIPLLLLIGACLLGGLTWMKNKGVPGWIAGCLRAPLAGGVWVLASAATVFLMVDESAVFQYWQVAVSWLLYLASTGLFIYQQWNRLIR